MRSEVVFTVMSGFFEVQSKLSFRLNEKWTWVTASSSARFSRSFEQAKGSFKEFYDLSSWFKKINKTKKQKTFHHGSSLNLSRCPCASNVSCHFWSAAASGLCCAWKHQWSNQTKTFWSLCLNFLLWMDSVSIGKWEQDWAVLAGCAAWSRSA